MDAILKPMLLLILLPPLPFPLSQLEEPLPIEMPASHLISTLSGGAARFDGMARELCRLLLYSPLGGGSG